jgi:hypothetical protein
MGNIGNVCKEMDFSGDRNEVETIVVVKNVRKLIFNIFI